MNCTGSDSKGLSVDTQCTLNGGTISATVSAASSKAIRASQNLVINGGTFTFDVSGNASKAISAEVLDIEGGTFTVNTSGAPVVTNYDPSYCTGFKATTYTQNGGNIGITCKGQANKGISIDGTGTFNAGTVNIGTSGAGGYYRASASAYDTYASCAITGNGDLHILGGTYTLTSTGTGGKAIKCDGALTIGTTAGGPAITATTSGAQYKYTNNYTSSSKAIKAQGAIAINGGSITAKTSTSAAEGIESKTSLTVNGGDVIVNAYDDAINSSGPIVFNGGRTYAYASNNDAIDSNYGRSGAIAINGGIVIAAGASSPEEGLDCDNNAYIVVSGGTLFCMGGNQGGGGGMMGGGGTSSKPSCSQGTVYMSGVSLTQNQYLTLATSGGTNIFTVKLPRTISQASGFLSDAAMADGAYTLTTSSTASTTYSSEWQGLCLNANTTTGTSVGTVTVSSHYGSVGGGNTPGGGFRP